MGLAATLARRSLLQRPGRTLFSVLGVAVGIATVVFVYTLDYNTLQARVAPESPEQAAREAARSGETGTWSADIEVRPKQGLPNPAEALRATPGVMEAVAFFEKDANLVAGGPKGGPDNRLSVKLFALEARAAPDLEPYYLKEGRHIEPGSADREVLVGEALAERFDLELGSRVFLAQPPRAARKVCREGEIQEITQVGEPTLGEAFEVVGILRREKIGRQSRGEVVVVDYDRGRELFRTAFVEPSFWVKRDPSVGVERLEAGLGKQYTYDLDRRVVVGQTAEEVAFRNGVLAAGLLALALGLYVIFHTLSVSLVERVREVGVLSSLGTRRRQIARIFFLEALFIVLLAGGLGLAGGLAIARELLSHGITTIGSDQHIDIERFDVPWSVVGPLCLLGMAIALLGSVYPLVKARHTDVVAVLRGEDALHSKGVARGFHLFAALLLVGVLPALYFFIVPVVGERQGPLVGAIMAGVGIMAVFLALPLVVPAVVGVACGRFVRFFAGLWPLAGSLAARTVERSPTRVASSVSAIALVTAAFVGLRGMTNSLEAEVQVWADEAVAHKVWVQRLPNVPFERVREALAIDGVLGIESRSANERVPFLLLGMRASELARYGPCARDPRLVQELVQRRGMIVSKRLAMKLGYRVGDEVLVNTAGHGVQSFPVVAISDEYGYFHQPDERQYGVISDVHMKRFFCKDVDTVDHIGVRLAAGTDPGVVEAALTAAFPAAASRLVFDTDRDVLGLHLRDIRKDFRLFDFILGLTALLAGLGVLNGQLLSALERSKELGVLRALGMSRGQIAGTVLIESTVVGAIGGALGLGLGSLLTPVIVDILQVVSGLQLPHRSAGSFLAICLIGALGLTALAGLYPIWRMSRMDAVAAVRAG